MVTTLLWGRPCPLPAKFGRRTAVFRLCHPSAWIRTKFQKTGESAGVRPMWRGVLLPRIGSHSGYMPCPIPTFKLPAAASAPTHFFSACHRLSYLIDPGASLRSTSLTQTSPPHSAYFCSPPAWSTSGLRPNLLPESYGTLPEGLCLPSLGEAELERRAFAHPHPCSGFQA